MKLFKNLQIIIGLICPILSFSQAKAPYVNTTFGKGIGFASSDSSFTLALSGRIQSMSEVKHELNTNTTLADFYVRRCRLNIQGKAFHPSFTYRIQLGFAQGDIKSDNASAQNNLILRDAMMYYSPNKWLRIGTLTGKVILGTPIAEVKMNKVTIKRNLRGS
jgi:hypothetical protein